MRGRLSFRMHIALKHTRRMASLYEHVGKLKRAVTLILRRESKFCSVKFPGAIHSACSCEQFVMNSFPESQILTGANLGGVAGIATPPNDFEQSLPLIYKAYYSLAQ